MKQYKNIIAVILLLPFIVSCKKFLSTVPPDSLSPVNYYNTQADLERALAGVYDRLQDTRVYGECIPTNLSFSDEFFYARATSEIKANFIDPSTLELNRNYESLYAGIERANMLLENVDKANTTDAVKNEVKGQALFLRAYYYYLLADMYGDVPFKLTSSKSPAEPPLPQTPAKQIFEKVVADMKEAAGLVVPSVTYGGKISKSAVQGILARVLLKMAGYPFNDTGKYEEAKAYCDSVITSGLHELNPDYKQIFINHCEDKYDVKESIWEVEFYGNNAAQIKEAGRIGVVNGISCTNLNIGYGYDMIRTSAKLYNSYGSGDLRRDWCVAPYVYQVVNNITSKKTWLATQVYDRNPGKWRREYEVFSPKVKDFSAINFPLLRYADVLLMRAEAGNEMNGPADALSFINQVRRRAFGIPGNTLNVAVDIPSGISQSALRDTIRNERFRELAFEGLRKHDLIRWGVYVSTMKDFVNDIAATAPADYKYASTAAKNVAERSVLFPIPNTEIAVNKTIIQNPGW
ncbi:RagB/SusD family nutrient uptake outer membrane protein [Niabella aquatica]